jgi:hypothetical protein
MPFFGKNYTLRRFGESQVVNGYQTAGHTDQTVFLDVQTISDDEVKEDTGSRDSMMLKTFGDFPIRCTKQEDGVQPDRLFYDGRWYECTASRLSQNTFIKHWTSTFALLPEEPVEDEETEDES